MLMPNLALTARKFRIYTNKNFWFYLFGICLSFNLSLRKVKPVKTVPSNPSLYY